MHISSSILNAAVLTTVAFLTFGVVLLLLSLEREDWELAQMFKNKINLSFNISRLLKRF
jgi:hypothetical protein